MVSVGGGEGGQGRADDGAQGRLDGALQVQKELAEVERAMWELERDREEKCKRIMDRRVHQVNTLQELGQYN